MDIFKFNPLTTVDNQNGIIINGALSKRWTERYRDAGDFELVAPMSAGWRETLPEGTFLSHLGTQEVMIVENHEFTESEETGPIITVTGRSLETYLENRVVGMNQARNSEIIDDTYEAGDKYTWEQAVDLINDHIFVTEDESDNLNGYIHGNAVTSLTGTHEQRSINFGDVYQALIDVLTVDDLGIRSIRRSMFDTVNNQATTDWQSATVTELHVHKGRDKTKSVIFSTDRGDLNAAKYLFSARKYKNAALVKGRYIWTIVTTSPYTGYNRRYMIVDAQDVDERYQNPPNEWVTPTIIAKLTTRGRQALKKQLRINLQEADVSSRSRYVYRKDYDIGDMVMIDGSYGKQAMRVVEFTEIQDGNASSGHPTLEIPGVD